MKMYFVDKISINRATFYKHKSLNDLFLSFDNKIIVGNLIDFAKYLQRKITDIEKTENILPENSFGVNEAATEMYRIEIRRRKDDIVVAYMECRQVKDVFDTVMEQEHEDYLKSMNKQKNIEEQLYRELRDVLSAYIRMFEDKHEVDMQFSVDEELIGVLDFGYVYFFHIADVVYDIDHDLPKGLILQWAEDSIDDSKNPTRQTIDLHSYAKGLRFEDLQKNKRYNSRIRSKRSCTSKKAKCETEKRSKEK